jgi:hypothetical protein
MSGNSLGRPSNSLHFAVGEVNGKLDQLIAAILPQLQALRDEDRLLGNRVTTLEARSYKIIGGGSVVVFLIGSWELVRYVIHR